MAGTSLCARCLAILSAGPHDFTVCEDSDCEDTECEDTTCDDHYIDREEFYEAAKQGCYICSWVWDAHRRTKQDNHRAFEPLLRTSYRWNDRNPQYERSAEPEDITITISVETASEVVGAFRHFKFFRSDITDRHFTLFNTKLGPYIRSEETFSLLRRWIDQCCSQHVECQSLTTPTELPTRLIYVYPAGDDAKLRANICRGASLRKGTPYLTLSHCWGEIEFLTTRNASLSAYECSLPIESLSRTFQDALLATVKLGFQYIWIDSLCIVQDDPADWERESLSMHRIYKHATCNVSASGFANGKDGFIMNERRFDPTPVAVNLGNSCTQNFFETPCYLALDQPWKLMREGPIFKRAWTLQEQLLAKRTVHFDDNQVYWVCKSTVANELWPCGWLNTSFEHRFRQEMDSSWLFKLDHMPNDKTSFYNSWFEIVSEYSNRRLTFDKDRLPALAGITAEFEKHLKDDSVYGLWKNDMHRGILFTQSDRTYKPQNSKDLPAWRDIPSWSWASLDKPVSWSMRPLNRRSAHFTNIHVVQHLATLQLQLSTTFLIRPSEYPSSLMTNDQGYPDELSVGLNQRGFEFIFHPDQWFSTTFMESPTSIGSTTDSHEFYATAKHEKSPLETTVIVPILCDGWHRNWAGNKYASLWCLLLDAPPGAQDGMYVRAGVVVVTKYYDNEIDVDSNMIMAEFEAYRRPVARNLFQEEVDDHGNYTIAVM